MRQAQEPALIIADGGLGGLMACWAEGMCGRRGRAGHGDKPNVAWFPGPMPEGIELPARERRWRAVGVQAELCGLAEPGAQRAEGENGGEGPEGMGWTRMLLGAAGATVERGLGRVVWPVHAGEGDLDAVADVCDRAMLVSQLAGLDLPAGMPGGLTVETPYADFSDNQMMDLAVDMDTPLWACWWCEGEAEAACGTCAACRRFGVALEAVAPGSAGRLLRGPGRAVVVGASGKKAAVGG